MCSQLFILYTVYNSVRDFKTDVGRTVDLGNKFLCTAGYAVGNGFQNKTGDTASVTGESDCCRLHFANIGVKILMQLYFILGLSDETVSRGAGDRLKLGVKGNRLFKKLGIGINIYVVITRMLTDLDRVDFRNVKLIVNNAFDNAGLCLAHLGGQTSHNAEVDDQVYTVF